VVLLICICCVRLKLSSLLSKLYYKYIIERPPLKARLGDVAQEYWVNSLLNLCLDVFPIMFSFTTSLPVYFAILLIRCTK